MKRGQNGKTSRWRRAVAGEEQYDEGRKEWGASEKGNRKEIVSSESVFSGGATGG